MMRNYIDLDDDAVWEKLADTMAARIMKRNEKVGELFIKNKPSTSQPKPSTSMAASSKKDNR